jgi:hypothetical protein
MTRYILLGTVLLSLVTYAAFGQSSRTSDPGTQPTATITALTVGSGNLTFSQNGESISNGTNGTILFTRDDPGTITFSTADDNANAAAIYQAGGTGNIVLGSATNGTMQILTNGTASPSQQTGR